MKVIIAHPGKQHAYKLATLFKDLGYEVVFCTGIAFNKPPKFIPHIISSKRLFNNNITLKSFFTAEILYHILNRIINPIRARFIYERWFDKIVSLWLKNQNFDIFIGYEVSTLHCFSVAKEKGKLCILDLAQIHYKALEQQSTIHKELAYLSKGKTRNKINQIKKNELESANYIFSISDFVTESLISSNIPSKKILKLPIWNEVPNIKSRERLNKEFHILYVGTIRDQKGISLLIDSIDSLNNPLIKLCLIGGINELHYHQIIEERPYIKHISSVQHERLNEYYSKSDLFILPSYLDSWGMVVIEAMSNGIPVIVTENVGAKEAALKGGGLVVSTGNKSELTKAIHHFIQNPTQSIKTSEEAYKIAQSYDKENIKNILKQHLQKIKTKHYE